MDVLSNYFFSVFGDVLYLDKTKLLFVEYNPRKKLEKLLDFYLLFHQKIQKQKPKNSLT